MKGTLKHTTAGWFVWYNVMRDEITSGYESLPLHPDDLDSEVIRWANNGSLDNKEIEFEIKYHWDGIMEQPVEVAKLIKPEYPELEGTNELCEDIIAARDSKKIPAPDELQQELRRVRVAKNAHVKAQNWELAALYREIEKLLQSEEHTCSNCQMMLSAIGVGQGLICDLNKCRIPHSKHSCQYHFKTVTKSAENASFDSEQQESSTYRLTDELIYAESAKKGYAMLATQLAWEDGAKWCRDALQK